MEVVGSECGVVANVLDCDIVVSDFEFQSRYYVHFWKRYEPPYPPSYKYHSCSTRMVVILNNPRSLICHKTKTK